MSVQSINPQVPNYAQARPKKERYPWHAVASFMLPGTGQFIKGDKRKGKIDLGVLVGLSVAYVLAGYHYMKKESPIQNGQIDFGKLRTHDFNKDYNAGPLAAIFGLAMFAHAIHSAVDAYKSEPVNKS